jgi:acyl carrier protein
MFGTVDEDHTEMIESTVAAEIRTFIVSNFLFGQEGKGFADDVSFLETGIIDSTGLLELVAFVEQKYGIAVADRELLPENLDSLRNVSQFVMRKREMVGSAAQS